MGCGHPDKVADAITDAILDACLAQDPESRVGCETLIKGNQVILAGEMNSYSMKCLKIIRHAGRELK